MTMKLLSLTLPSKNIPRLGTLSNITIDQPMGGLSGFRVSVRGPSVFLISPPGWRRDLARAQWRADGPCSTFELPRTECILEWEGDQVDQVSKYDSPPMQTDDERRRAVADAADKAAQKKVA